MGEIGNIFNGVDRKKENNCLINSSEFNIKFIENFLNGIEYEDKSLEKNFKNSKSDFKKRYYGSLLASSEELVSKYDEDKLENSLNRLSEELILVGGDFFGIQNFIFDNISANKASKILRSRSAIVLIITHIVSQVLKSELAGEIVSNSAGKFLIIANINYKDKIDNLQKEINQFFMNNYFAISGIILSYSETTKEKLKAQSSEEFKKDLENLDRENELNKLKKFNLTESKESNYSFNIFEKANSDDAICKFCFKRVGEEKKIDGDEKEIVCKICVTQIELGKKLGKSDFIYIDKSKKDIKNTIFKYKEFNYSIFFSDKELNRDSIEVFDISDKNLEKISNYPKWALKSYIPLREEDNEYGNKDEPKTFDEILNNSSGLMALKADVDNLGNTFRDYYYNCFKKYNRLSRELDFFFSEYVTYIVKKEFPNIYIVFSGGDDLFLIGEYREVIDFIKKLREDFYKFSLEKSTLSMGIIMFKPNTPINYVAKAVEEAEGRAKKVLYPKAKDILKNRRDGVDIFGVSMKFSEFIKIENRVKEFVDFLNSIENETSKTINSSALFYKLIEFCDMAENRDKKIENFLWKSKLNYTFKRNILTLLKDESLREKASNFSMEIAKLIEDFKEKVKPSIFIQIYKRRDSEPKV